MPNLYLTAIQPNPPGRDVVRPGVAANSKLNEEWVEFRADGSRNLTGDILTQLVFDRSCRVEREAILITFGAITLLSGQRVRVHTGSGVNQQLGDTFHLYANRSWFVWNNACGDRATLKYSGAVIDTAYYHPNPPEGVLMRVPGTELFQAGVPSAFGYR